MEKGKQKGNRKDGTKKREDRRDEGKNGGEEDSSGDDGNNRKERERRKKIEESKFNELYKDVMTEEVPIYLRERKGKKERSLIARFRCGNEMRGNQYWKKEEDKKCRVCKEGMENVRHVLKECEATKEKMTIEEFMKEDSKS